MQTNVASADRQEHVDTFDENFKFLGAIPRDLAHAQGAWHQAVHCWIINTSSEPSLLFQLRSPRTSFFPNRLDITAAGHVSAGETKAAVLREVQEELMVRPLYEDLVDLGVKIDVGKCGEVVNREFSHVFLWRRPQAAVEYCPNPAEVAGLYEIPLKEGVRLFAGELPAVQAAGMVWMPESSSWRKESWTVSPEDFVPRIDKYYLRVFVLAQRLIRGERYLAI